MSQKKAAGSPRRKRTVEKGRPAGAPTGDSGARAVLANACSKRFFHMIKRFCFDFHNHGAAKAEPRKRPPRSTAPLHPTGLCELFNLGAPRSPHLYKGLTGLS